MTGDALDPAAPELRAGPVYEARRVCCLVGDDTAGCCSERGETTDGPASDRTVTRAADPMLAGCAGRVQLSGHRASATWRSLGHPKNKRRARRLEASRPARKLARRCRPRLSDAAAGEPSCSDRCRRRSPAGHPAGVRNRTTIRTAMIRLARCAADGCGGPADHASRNVRRIDGTRSPGRSGPWRFLTVGAGAQASLDAASPRRFARSSQGVCRTNELASAVDTEASSMCE